MALKIRICEYQKRFTWLSKSLSAEYGKLGIRINTVNQDLLKLHYPKFKKTNLYKWTLVEHSQIDGRSLMKGKFDYFLLSDKSKYINGEDINIDGGWLSS